MRGYRGDGINAAASLSGQDAVDALHKEAIAPFRKADGSYRIGATFKAAIARRALSSV